MPRRHQLNITKKDPPKCRVCGSTNVEYQIGYRDMRYPVTVNIGGRTITAYNHSGEACLEHVAEVTAINPAQGGFDEI